MSRLDKVVRGQLHDPPSIFLYGSEGVGKTTVAASAPSPIIIDIENGSGQLSVDRYSFRDEPSGHVPHTLQEINEALDDLLTSEHEYKTLVIDTVDRLEPLIWQFLLDRDSGKMSALNKSGKKLVSLESYGYGRGFQLAVDLWREFSIKLDKLRLTRGMTVILLGHAQVRTFKNPEGEDYDRWMPRMNALASGYLKEWAQVTGFCCFEEGGSKLTEDDRTRAKGWSTGVRLIRFRRHAAYDAKSRIPMPEQVEMDLQDPWAPFAAAMSVAQDMPADELVKLIGTELKRIGDKDLTNKVRASVKAANGDRSRLGRFLGELQNRRPKEEARDE